MPRYKLEIEYDGRGFAGWQSQAEDLTIQAVMEEAVLRINSQPATVQAAGRTDAGVHATGQVAHVDLVKDWEPFVLCNALNANLRPHRVAVVAAEQVTPEFHARFTAIKRHYLYRILNRRAPPALDKGQVWHVPVKLDAEAMHEAAQELVGHHDFTTFRAAQCQAQSPVKTLDRLDVMRFGEFIEIHAEARSFLHNQVRSMVGSLKLVGDGRWNRRDLARALKMADRAECGPVAPPDGLYLIKVSY